MSSVSGSPNHYDVLGVTRTARVEDIRQAYRALARDHHPDRHGGRTTAEMVRINEAWRVLSDVQRRKQYDDTISGVEGLGQPPTTSPTIRHFGANSSASVVPARFPWKFVVGFFAFATLVILLIGAFTEPGETLPIDNIIRVGSCVDVDRQIQEAWEVSCDGSHDSQVVRMVPFDGRCPVDTETFRDRQGLGLVCAVP
ncbi:MAG: J domain-containing protein [Actinomycetota bacterium]